MGVPVACLWGVCETLFQPFTTPPSGRLGSVLCGHPPVAPTEPHKLSVPGMVTLQAGKDSVSGVALLCSSRARAFSSHVQRGVWWLQNGYTR